jgi:GNAT superfamily N-acetyltransferase
MENQLGLRFATVADVPVILAMIKELAEYEKLSHEVVATEADLRQSLFGKQPQAEVILAEYQNMVAGFALFFHSFSTFVGKPGIYLEDLYIKPEMRGNGFGKQLLAYLAKLAQERNCGRLEWSVLNWNQPAINVYQSIGAKAMDDWTVYRVTGQALVDLAAKYWQPSRLNSIYINSRNGCAD